MTDATVTREQWQAARAQLTQFARHALGDGELAHALDMAIRLADRGAVRITRPDARNEITIVRHLNLAGYVGDELFYDGEGWLDDVLRALGYSLERIEVRDWKDMPDLTEGSRITPPKSLAYLLNHLDNQERARNRQRIAWLRQELARLEDQEKEGA